jgi:transposase-like protein
MDASCDDVLAYMSFPREHWAQIASTNPLERVNREVKRRSDVIGIFPNDEAIVRLVGASAMDLEPCVDGSRGARALLGRWVWSVAAMCTASDVQRGSCAP